MNTASLPRTLVTHPETPSHHSLPVFHAVGEPQKECDSSARCPCSPTSAPAKGRAPVLLMVKVFLLLAAGGLL